MNQANPSSLISLSRVISLSLKRISFSFKAI
jgi:hypothetical protein